MEQVEQALKDVKVASDEEVSRRKAEELKRSVEEYCESVTGFMPRHISQHRLGYPAPADLRQQGWSRTLDRVKAQLKIPGATVALVGPRGTGKTQLAYAAAHDHITRRMSYGVNQATRYCRVLDFFMTVKATYNDSERNEQGAIASFASPTLLVLDEVQVRFETAWESMQLTHLMDTRYGRFASTILISNLLPSVFEEAMGESIMDRLRETGTVYECDWPSFRAREA